MKILIQSFFVLLFFSCSGQPTKKQTVTVGNTADSSIVAKHADSLKRNPQNCFEYLTGLVRSSNFPYPGLKIDGAKVKLLVDEETEEVISCKLYFDTEGTGTLGWIEYHKRSGKLFNTSPNLDSSVELTCNPHWKSLFDKCRAGENQTLQNTSVANQLSLEKTYFQSGQLSLPVKYGYDLIAEEKGFLEIDKEYYRLFSIKSEDNLKMARLPVLGKNVMPAILISYADNGQSIWRLIIFDGKYRVVSQTVLYSNKETGNGSEVTTFSISERYAIEVKKSATSGTKEKMISKRMFTISPTGLLIAH